MRSFYGASEATAVHNVLSVEGLMKASLQGVEKIIASCCSSCLLKNMNLSFEERLLEKRSFEAIFCEFWCFK